MSVQVAIIGSGSFGTALAKTIADNGHDVIMYVRNATLAETMRVNNHNPKYLSDYTLPNNIHYSHDLQTCVQNAQIVVLALPSHASLAYLDTLARYMHSEQILMSTVKGVVETPEFLVSGTIEKTLAHHDKSCAVAVLSGPNLAKEIIAQQCTGTVIASNHAHAIDATQTVLQNNWLSVHTSDDVIGVELGGALKNIYAVAAGMVDALGMGDNCKSLLLANGMFEMIKFADTFSADIHTLCGLSGVGDLITTCISSLSRNYRLGASIVSGKSVNESQQLLGGVAEGLTTLKIVHQKAQEMNIVLPIVAALHATIYENAPVADFVAAWLHDQVFLHT